MGHPHLCCREGGPPASKPPAKISSDPQTGLLKQLADQPKRRPALAQALPVEWQAVKIVCHNICCLIQEIHEFGITAEFWKDRNESAATCAKTLTLAQ